MQIIQFHCNDANVALALQSKILELANRASRLHFLSGQPGYVTQPFGLEQFKTHTTDTTLYWANWDGIYNNLGDDGRVIADILLSPGELTGLLNGATLVKSMAETVLEIVTVADPVASGYMASVQGGE